jgi:uncharacterized protein (TIGR02466 family)
MTLTAHHAPLRTALNMWRTPIYQADCPNASDHLPALRELILEAEKNDTDAANFGGIDAIKSSQELLTWQHPAVDWIKAQIMAAVTALTETTLGEAAREVTGHGIHAEAWAVVYRGGGSLRPHTHHDSAWSGVLYVAADAEAGAEAGYLQMLDPRPAAIARQASSGVVRIQPIPGRMVAFPGWLPHSVKATATGSDLRIAVAWNVAYDENWTGMA